jgi:hypothetical protein
MVGSAAGLLFIKRIHLFQETAGGKSRQPFLQETTKFCNLAKFIDSCAVEGMERTAHR